MDNIWTLVVALENAQAYLSLANVKTASSNGLSEIIPTAVKADLTAATLALLT